MFYNYEIFTRILRGLLGIISVDSYIVYMGTNERVSLLLEFWGVLPQVARLQGAALLAGRAHRLRGRGPGGEVLRW